MSKNNEKFCSFSSHCEEHPEQTFWKALLSWAQQVESPDIKSICVHLGFEIDEETGNPTEITEDTFNWE